jgi:hypothetical protein
MNKETDMSAKDIYAGYRAKHGIMDSIRFTAKDMGVKPIDAARELGLADAFIAHKLSPC